MILKAIKFAAIKHEKQKRKGSKLPFIVHPMEVMLLLMQENCSDDVIVAGILHDTIEDTNTTKEEVEKEFGKNVLDLVLFNTEDKTKSWMERKTATIEAIKTATFEQKMLVCADKVSNLNSLEQDSKILGETLWNSFNSTKEQSKWYYEEVFKGLNVLEGTKVYAKYKEVLQSVFETVID